MGEKRESPRKMKEIKAAGRGKERESGGRSRRRGG